MDHVSEMDRLIPIDRSPLDRSPIDRRKMETHCVRRARALSKLKPLGPIMLSSLLFAIVICILYITGRATDLYADPILGVDDKLHLRWGVVGLGRITGDFVVALRMIGADLEAVRT